MMRLYRVWMGFRHGWCLALEDTVLDVPIIVRPKGGANRLPQRCNWIVNVLIDEDAVSLEALRESIASMHEHTRPARVYLSGGDAGQVWRLSWAVLGGDEQCVRNVVQTLVHEHTLRAVHTTAISTAGVRTEVARALKIPDHDRHQQHRRTRQAGWRARLAARWSWAWTWARAGWRGEAGPVRPREGLDGLEFPPGWAIPGGAVRFARET